MAEQQHQSIFDQFWQFYLAQKLVTFNLVFCIFFQARQMVNLEMRERQKIEQECEELQKQWGSLQNLVNSKVGIVNNDTLQRIRSSVSSSILNTPIGKGKKRDEMIAEYSQESILGKFNFDLFS